MSAANPSPVDRDQAPYGHQVADPHVLRAIEQVLPAAVRMPLPQPVVGLDVQDVKFLLAVAIKVRGDRNPTKSTAARRWGVEKDAPRGVPQDRRQTGA